MKTPSPWDDPRITAYVMGELSGDQRVAFEKELTTNSELSDAVDEARSVTDKLTGLFATESTPTLSAERRQEIASGATDSVPTISKQTSWKVPMLLLATAAVVALMIGIAPMIQNQPTTVSQVERDSPIHVADTEAVEFEELVADAPVSAVSVPSMTAAPEAAGKPISSERLDKRLSISAYTKKEQSSAGGAMGGGNVELDYGNIAGDAITADQAMTSGMALAYQGPSPTSADHPFEDGVEAKGNPPTPASPNRRSRRSGMGMDGFAMDTGMSGGTDNVEMNIKMGDMDMGGMDEKMMRTEGMETGMMDMDMDMDMGMDMDMPAPTPNAVGNQTTPHFAGSNRSDKSRPNLELNRDRLKKSQLLETAPGIAALPDIRVVPRQESLFGRTSGDKFAAITENEFKRTDEETLSTFSIDVDTASYSKTRDILMRANQWPRPDAVRIEEMVNYFDYNYAPPANDAKHPFAAEVEITSCPWNDQHRLARIGIQGKTMKSDERPRCNLVFLIDTSGSMNSANKLPLVLEGLKMLTKQLDSDDRVAIVVYAGSAGLVLDSTSAKKGKKIAKALTQLSAGGSTNGGAGIQLAYQTARENFVAGGVNRVILCSDGDFNVGTTGTDALVRLVEDEAKSNIFLTVLGFGMGNHNDAMMEQISGRGNGNYAFIDNSQEAHKVLVDQISGTLVTIAKDVKLQVDFNPAKVTAYRLIGYENRILAKEDFNDDKKDAGEIGAGHSVTALYEIVPVGADSDSVRPKVEESKYIAKPEPAAKPTSDSNETLTVRIRYKQPDGDTSTRVDFPIVDQLDSFDEADESTRFAAAVAGFGMQLRHSKHAGDWEMSDVLETAKASKGIDEDGLRTEFIKLVKKASSLK
ncbi:YfbK domain-containing protein [Rubripirellula reticaptiva]|uniref:von Willebrand factor n=1 Tax=Rubripirellula reticaptiva TaxID=2528013 RepID=A0A5C6F1B4_9BACT|nr:von Willebrand factor type A domain-containing protein [Rubripirellula reticaptiva]TWU55148.1 von Willebrand factor [Rubripirellula reticaptiva]